MNRSGNLFWLILVLQLAGGPVSGLAAEGAPSREQPANESTAPEQAVLSKEDREVVEMLELLEMMDLLNAIEDVAVLEDTP